MTLTATWPSEILDHRASHALELTWPDGVRSRLSYRHLRSVCRCAECQGRRRNAETASVAVPPVPDTLELVGITPVGDTGLQLHFSDGHERGIFPWAYLRELSEAAVRT
jgi:DUF971 family protein